MPFTLWMVAVKELRWACSELIMNCGPNSSHVSDTTKNLVCTEQQIKWTRNSQQGQECPHCCDLSDHPADLILDSFLRLCSECAVISGGLVTISSKLPSFKDLTTFNIWDNYHQCFHTEQLYNLSLVVPSTLLRYFMSSGSMVTSKVSPHFYTQRSQMDKCHPVDAKWEELGHDVGAPARGDALIPGELPQDGQANSHSASPPHSSYRPPAPHFKSHQITNI